MAGLVEDLWQVIKLENNLFAFFEKIFQASVSGVLDDHIDGLTYYNNNSTVNIMCIQHTLSRILHL